MADHRRIAAATAVRLAPTRPSVRVRCNSMMHRRLGGHCDPELLEHIEQVQLQPVLCTPAVT